MGACDIWMVAKPNLTKRDAAKLLKEQQEEDAYQNGHRHGYSGDFQTVDSVKLVDKVFDNRNEAEEFCLSNAEKWFYVVAVEVKTSDQHYTLIGGWGAC